MTVHTTCPSPLGELTLVADSDALAGLYFAGHAPAPAIALGPRDPGALVDAREQLAEYFAGGRSTFTLALAPRGTSFQRAVWERISAIPYGETLTYAALATQLHAHPRAVGGASARNPLSIVVPCHRMVTSAGGLAGYGGGVERKRALLFHEGALS
jgi:methylated-DNA-[protein]-cysteine S-methyltransferase